MIYINMLGNLGNQLFEYAYARKIQELTGQKVTLNTCFLEKYYKDYKFNLNSYKLNENIIIEKKNKLPFFMNINTIFAKVILRAISKNKKIDEKVSNLIYNVASRKGYYLWLKETYKEIKLYNRKNYYITGFWQSPYYFDDIKDIIIKELQPKCDLLEENKELYSVISNNESICVTIRRGDYVHNEEIRKSYLVCNEEFYYNAVNKIKEEFPEAVVICFSDDIEWVKENLKFNCKTYYESGKDPVWEKLRLMSLCKHFVISNSSFSWWAQYLSTNEDKIVYAPKQWYADGRKADIFEKSWRYLEDEWGSE